MATKILKITGTAYWARVFEENKDATGYNDELKDTGGQYTVNMVLENDEIQKLVKANSQTTDYPKTITDSEGNEVEAYRFKRQHEKYDRKGNLLEWASGAPEVVGSDGTPWDIEEDGGIGNGSTLELTVAVYKAGPVYGTRLEKVKVVDFVPVPEVEVA